MPSPSQQPILKYEAVGGGDLRWSEEGWRIRSFIEADFDDVYNLCRAAFPLDYPNDWYRDVVTRRYISFGLYHRDVLTSLLVAELKTIGECDPEDRTLCKDPNTTVVYILSLAVGDQYKRRGLATVLLKHLMAIIYNVQQPLPRLIFLHVLCDNLPAIFFYHKNGFRHHATMPNYYLIEGKYRDGFTFVRHLTPGPFGELLSSIYQACSSLIHFLAVPFRRCIINQSSRGGRADGKHSPDPADRLVSI